MAQIGGGGEGCCIGVTFGEEAVAAAVDAVIGEGCQQPRGGDIAHHPTPAFLSLSLSFLYSLFPPRIGSRQWKYCLLKPNLDKSSCR